MDHLLRINECWLAAAAAVGHRRSFLVFVLFGCIRQSSLCRHDLCCCCIAGVIVICKVVGHGCCIHNPGHSDQKVWGGERLKCECALEFSAQSPFYPTSTIRLAWANRQKTSATSYVHVSKLVFSNVVDPNRE